MENKAFFKKKEGGGIKSDLNNVTEKRKVIGV